ncbi:hypothetical protein COM13_29055 [Bacillus pseudomycoides]|uniref:Uncharacterized protein n=1 Tax=Bacillus pseudomycoides TaxID=64104 RepID=A0ABD6T5L9_9BACI|nr:hypothetical protein [Bacillus pseudomycoides]MED4654569.1 hypothetical protein [Bacillus pseudomycoides]PDX97297.1 hypothetical protein COO07_28055 [Bacillus pseudomycoides]PDZ08986.1 hypothetical protein CON70_24695 [Bacillus pseudomycoides]PEE02880.1 hypothetical protein CON86_28645 [Bacillus pseudomycoides]PEJ27077.1 hypothetical protein CN677_27985 [Bacillus pseudomycoides]
MRIKGVLISFLVLVTFLGFLPIEKASASVSPNSVNEVGDRIDTSKEYYIVPADSPTRGLTSHPALNFYPFLVVSSRGNTVEKPSGTSMKLHFSEENKKYRIGKSYTMPPKQERGYLWVSSNLFFGLEEKNVIYWTITPVEGGYTLQAEGGYLNYKEYESPYGPLTRACLDKEKVVWKLVPAS